MLKRQPNILMTSLEGPSPTNFLNWTLIHPLYKLHNILLQCGNDSGRVVRLLAIFYNDQSSYTSWIGSFFRKMLF